MAVVNMRVGGNIVELSAGGGALPPGTERVLREALRYDHTTQLRGADAYDEVGNYRPTRIETRLMYHIDERGRFLALAGWQYRLKRMLLATGHQVVVADVDPPHPRPDRYLTDWDRLFAKMDLRVKQDEILASLEPVNHGLLHVPAGVGKTFLLAAYILAHPRARVHIITDGIDILHRIYRHLIKFIPNVGMVGGGKKRFGPQATVVSADSLHVVGEGFDDPNSPKAADVVFFDEVHKAGATTILAELRKYKRCRMYGMSANIGDRFDGADAQLEGLFGEVVFRMTYPEAEALGLVAPILVDWVQMDFDVAALELEDKRGVALDKWGLWRNDERSRRLGVRMAEFAPDVQCLAMVGTVEHAVRLKQHFPDYTLVYDQCKDYAAYARAGLLDPDRDPPMTPQRREQMRLAFEAGELKKVIATDVWSTGVDFAALGVMARADGRDSRIMDTQIPCRANRVYDGKERAVVIDCMDTFHATLLGRSNGRKRWYQKQGWVQAGLALRRIGVKAARQNRR